MTIFQKYQAIGLKLCFIVAVFLFNGCTYNYYYAPNAQNNLRLTKPNEVKGDFGIFRSAGTNGIIVHSAYSPVKNLGIQANYYRSSSNLDAGLKMQEGNLAIGTYYLHKFDPRENKTKHLFEPGFLFDLYAGIGIGQNKNGISELFNNLTTRTRFNYHKYYMQAGIHLQTFGAITIGYTFRLFYLDYKNALASGEILDAFIDDLNLLKANDPFLLRENSIKFSVGSNKINYYLAANILSRRILNRDLFYHSSIQTGMEFSISELFARKKMKVSNTTKP